MQPSPYICAIFNRIAVFCGQSQSGKQNVNIHLLFLILVIYVIIEPEIKNTFLVSMASEDKLLSGVSQRLKTGSVSMCVCVCVLVLCQSHTL